MDEETESRLPRRDSNPGSAAVAPRVARAPPRPHRRSPRAGRARRPTWSRARASSRVCSPPCARGSSAAPHPTPTPAPEPGNLRRREEGAGWERGGANNGGKARGGAARGNPRPGQMELLWVCNVSAGSLARRPWGRGVTGVVSRSGLSGSLEAIAGRPGAPDNCKPVGHWLAGLRGCPPRNAWVGAGRGGVRTPPLALQGPQSQTSEFQHTEPRSLTASPSVRSPALGPP